MYLNIASWVLFLIPSVLSLSADELLVIFGEKDCIPGTLANINDGSKDSKSHAVFKKPSIDYVTSLESSSEKSSLSSIYELAQYNEINYSFELINEEGPPHDKLFTITLYLGDEQYTSQQKSIKKAQQEAAGKAIKNTKYLHPPVKVKENAKTLTPTVLLNNLAAKLGLSVTYTVVTGDIIEELNNNVERHEDYSQRKSYLQKLNETLHSNDTIRVRKDGGDLKGPFTVRVDVNGVKFYGEAHTVKNAKHEAALAALKTLREDQSIFQCLKEDDNCKSKKQTNKSPISLVYEAAQTRNLGVEFEVIDEIGPAHKKMFTTKCTVGELEATGEGRSKKESKKAAAENILSRLMDVPQVKSADRNVGQKSGKKSKKKNKKNKVIKTTFDKIDRMLDNVVDFGKGLVDSLRGDKQDDSKKPDLKNKHQKSPLEELLQLGKILDLNIQYLDVLQGDKTYSVLDLGTKPSLMCLGEGVTEKNARDLAAKFAISTLHKLGMLDNLFSNAPNSDDVWDKEEDFHKFWVEVQEDTKE